MRAPPTLSARQLFWWGTGLLAAGIALELLLLPLHLRLAVAVLLAAVLSALVSATKLLGAALIAASLAVAALGGATRAGPVVRSGPDRRPDEHVG